MSHSTVIAGSDRLRCLWRSLVPRRRGRGCAWPPNQGPAAACHPDPASTGLRAAGWSPPPCGERAAGAPPSCGRPAAAAGTGAKEETDGAAPGATAVARGARPSSDDAARSARASASCLPATTARPPARPPRGLRTRPPPAARAGTCGRHGHGVCGARRGGGRRRRPPPAAALRAAGGAAGTAAAAGAAAPPPPPPPPAGGRHVRRGGGGGGRRSACFGRGAPRPAGGGRGGARRRRGGGAGGGGRPSAGARGGGGSVCARGGDARGGAGAGNGGGGGGGDAPPAGRLFGDRVVVCAVPLDARAQGMWVKGVQGEDLVHSVSGRRGSGWPAGLCGWRRWRRDQGLVTNWCSGDLCGFRPRLVPCGWPHRRVPTV